MDMKKIMAITMLLVSLLTSTCFAADWYWLVSTDTTSHFVDRDSGQWNGSQLTCTEKAILNNDRYVLLDVTYDYSDYPRIKRRQNYIWFYNADGTSTGSDSDYKWEPLPPESNGEAIAIMEYHLFKSRRN